MTTISTTASEDQTNSEPSLFDIAVARIMLEAKCSQADAVAGIRFIEQMAIKARSSNRMDDVPGYHHLTTEEMDSIGYTVMDDVMPHGSTAGPDSAHAAIEKLILEPDEYALIHDNPTGLPVDCHVALVIRKFG